MADLDKTYIYAIDNRFGGNSLYRMLPNDSDFCEKYCGVKGWIKIDYVEAAETDLREIDLERAISIRDNIDKGE